MYIETVLSDCPVEFYDLSSQPAGTSGNTFLPVALSSDISNSLFSSVGGLEFPFLYQGNIFADHTLEFLVLPGTADTVLISEIINNVVVSATGDSGQEKVVANNSNIWPSYVVSGTNISPGTEVVSVFSDENGDQVIELSKPLLGNVAGNLTFSAQHLSSVTINNGVISVNLVTYSQSDSSRFMLSASLPTLSTNNILVSIGQELSIFANGELIRKAPVSRLASAPSADGYKTYLVTGRSYIAAAAFYKGAKDESFAKRHSDAVWTVRGQINFTDDEVCEFSSLSSTKVNKLLFPTVVPWTDSLTNGLVVKDRLEVNPYRGLQTQSGMSAVFGDGEMDCSYGGVVLKDVGSLVDSEYAVKFSFRLIEDAGTKLPLLVATRGASYIELIVNQEATTLLEFNFVGSDGDAVSATVDISSYTNLFSDQFDAVLVFNNDSSSLTVETDFVEIEHEAFLPDNVYIGSYEEKVGASQISGLKVALLTDDFVIAEFLSSSDHDTFVAAMGDSLDFLQYGTMTTTFVCNQITDDAVDGFLRTGYVAWEPEGAPVVVEVAGDEVACGYRPQAWESALPAESSIKVKLVYDSANDIPAYLTQLYLTVNQYDSQVFATSDDEILIFNPESIHENNTVSSSLSGMIITNGYCLYMPDTSADNKVIDWSFADVSQWSLPGSNHALVNDPTISTGYGISFDISSSGSVVSNTNKMPVAPSKLHQLCLYLRPSSQVTVTPKVAWYNHSSLISTSTGTSVATTGMLPQAIPASFTSPATATHALIEFVIVPSSTATVLLDTVIFAQGAELPDMQNFRPDHTYETLSFAVKKHAVEQSITQYLFNYSDGTRTFYLRLNSSGAIEYANVDTLMVNGVAVTAGSILMPDVWNHITAVLSHPISVTQEDPLVLFGDGRFVVDEVRFFRSQLTTEQQENVYKSYIGSFILDVADEISMPITNSDSCMLLAKPWVTP